MNERIRRRQSERQTGAREKSGRSIIITEFDGVILSTVFILLLIGIIMVFSSSYYTAMRNNLGMFYYVFKQIQAVLLGICGMLIMANINYHLLGKFTPLLYLVSNALFVYTYFFGRESHGARRWIEIPFFGSFQTSEFAKLAVILFLAFYICSKKDRLKSISGFIGAVVIILIPCGLAFFCTDSLSSALTIAALGFGMVFIASPYFWRFVAMLGAAFVGLLAYLNIPALSGFRGTGGRLSAYFDPFSDPIKYGYQTVQSLYAVASGGFFGLGLGNSRQKLIYMPEPHNDFIFAIICEELGFVGAAAVIFLFALLIYRGVRVALNAPDMLGTLMATGISVMIAVQVIINVGVVTNTIPNTGIPLPFISYGGSSVLFLMALIGILLNISRYSKVA